MEVEFSGKGIDCYGKIRKGESVEIIGDWGSDIVDNESYSDWSTFVAWCARTYGSAVQEAIAC